MKAIEKLFGASVAVVSLNAVNDVLALFELFGKVYADRNVRTLHFVVDGFTDIVYS